MRAEKREISVKYLSLGTIGIMPVSYVPSKSADIVDYAFRSSFDHTREFAYPGVCV